MYEDTNSERFNGWGTHHDRFVTDSEMLLIGVTLWRGVQWYKENQRRLTPEEQAQYELETERWKNYLRWENVTPGARQAREKHLWDQERAVREEAAIRRFVFHRVLFWMPFTLLLSVEFSANLIPGVGGFRQGAIEGAVGVAVWLVVWLFWIKLTAIWRRVRAAEAAVAMATASPVEPKPNPSPYLPVPYKSKPEEGRA